MDSEIKDTNIFTEVRVLILFTKFERTLLAHLF